TSIQTWSALDLFPLVSRPGRPDRLRSIEGLLLPLAFSYAASTGRGKTGPRNARATLTSDRHCRGRRKNSRPPPPPLAAIVKGFSRPDHAMSRSCPRRNQPRRCPVAYRP